MQKSMWQIAHGHMLGSAATTIAKYSNNNESHEINCLYSIITSAYSVRKLVSSIGNVTRSKKNIQL